MIIKSKLTERDFINANFVLLYSKTATKIFTAIISIFLIISILTFFLIPNNSYIQVIPIAVMFSALPLLTYFTSKKNYSDNQRLSETIEYQFDKDNLLMQGESFNAQLTWDKVYKVTQTKNWILIWQNRQFANPIPKRDIPEEQIKNLKIILNQYRIKNNL
ncbi:YcxB family protein [Polluticaenibacter yanchengensis]|uniref:YcxB family protein n=1 Tax=Polluticaenibacter yanchengensis TaxID=3014562 RepID=A0ABT4UNG0_9BACT|nr:YcxB family protein [Chitinophagaceae bacterium LY-5]